MKWFVKGDLDGFFALGLNNFINFLLIISLSTSVLGFSIEMIAERVLPAMALGLLFGNAFYAWQARQLGLKQGRNDVTAMPYGINLLPLFFFTFYVMLPAQQIALSKGLSKEAADIIAWKAGVVACLGSGLIEVVGSFFVHHLRKVASRAALLSALAAVGLFFIAADYTFRAYAFPEVGITTLLLTLYFFYGGVRLKGNIPGGFIVLVIGVLICWGSHWMGFRSPVDSLGDSGLQLGLHLPGLYGLEVLGGLGEMISYAAIIIPMGMINVIGSMQVIEAAAAAGDDYEPKQTLLVNGIGSVIAGGLGSPFPTTIYIGHLGMKTIGARAGYSLLNGVAMALLCLTGSLGLLSELVPIEAGMAILIWVGFTISAQAFQAVPEEHAPAIIAGLLPGMGAFCALILKRILGGVGYGTEAMPYTAELFHSLTESNLYANGIFALEQGWLYSSIVLTSVMVAIIDKKFSSVINWLLAGSIMAAVGIIHSFKVLETDVTSGFSPAWEWVLGYGLAALSLLFVRLCLVVKEEGEAKVVQISAATEDAALTSAEAESV
ncbi:hypothetical protein [Coraliomargarita parva]|uniref:hypothetical protein n=1 Tax=Coraliomargarita parva TaxID=3014050 RepID=UPI0022B2BE04|nr:hypothetical protein [Coraliomargarita parva]